MMRRQTGSISGFIIVACVLILVTLGVLYGVNRRSSSSERRTGDALQRPQSSTQSHPDEKTVAGRSEEAPVQPEGRRDAPQSEPRRDDAISGASRREAASVGGATSSARQHMSQGSAQGDLPTTGAADSLGGAMALGVTGAVTVAYVRSRKLL